MHRKYVVFLLAILFALPLLSSCSKVPDSQTEMTQKVTSAQTSAVPVTTKDITEAQTGVRMSILLQLTRLRELI